MALARWLRPKRFAVLERCTAVADTKIISWHWTRAGAVIACAQIAGEYATRPEVRDWFQWTVARRRDVTLVRRRGLVIVRTAS